MPRASTILQLKTTTDSRAPVLLVAAFAFSSNAVDRSMRWSFNAGMHMPSTSLGTLLPPPPPLAPPPAALLSIPAAGRAGLFTAGVNGLVAVVRPKRSGDPGDSEKPRHPQQESSVASLRNGRLGSRE